MSALLFSYGSNHPGQLAERLGHTVQTQAAYLPDYVRVFRGWSQRWGGGVASIKSEPGGVVYGSAATVSAADLARLDVYEGIATGNYKRKTIAVVIGDGRRAKAIAYVATSTEKNPPSREYLKAVAKNITTHWSGSDGRPVTYKDIVVR